MRRHGGICIFEDAGYLVEPVSVMQMAIDCVMRRAIDETRTSRAAAQGQLLFAAASEAFLEDDALRNGPPKVTKRNCATDEIATNWVVRF